MKNNNKQTRKYELEKLRMLTLQKKINKKSLKKSTKSYHNYMTVHALT